MISKSKTQKSIRDTRIALNLKWARTEATRESIRKAYRELEKECTHPDAYTSRDNVPYGGETTKCDDCGKVW